MTLNEWKNKYVLNKSGSQDGPNAKESGSKMTLSEWEQKYILPSIQTPKNEYSYSPAAPAEPPASYYSRPENLWADRESMEDNIKQYELNMKILRRNAMDMETAWQKSGSDTSFQMWEDAVNRYNAEYDAYTQYYSAYETYLSDQQNQYDAWRGTIRTPSQLKPILAASDLSIEKAKAEKTRIISQFAEAHAFDFKSIKGTPEEKEIARIDEILTGLYRKRELLDEEYKWAQQLMYEELMQNEDFEKLSKYKSTATGKPAQRNPLSSSGEYVTTGYADNMYEQINKNSDALEKLGLNNASSGRTALGNDKRELSEMSDDEIAIFNYLYAKDDAIGDKEHKSAYEYLDYIRKDLTYRQRQKDAAELEKYAKENPLGSSAFSVMISPLRAFSAAGQAADYLDDGKIDENAGYNKFSHISSDIRGAVSEEVEKKWGAVGSFAYNTGMSMADFVVNTALSGGSRAFAMTLMGSEAAADTVIDGKKRGLSDNQAFTLGVISGIAEAVTEKFSVEAVLDKTTLGKTALGYWLNNTITEAREEGASNIINTIADVMVSRDKSEWQTAIDGYIEQGLSEKEAFYKALGDQAVSLGLDMLAGAISGGVMAAPGVAAQGVYSAANKYAEKLEEKRSEDKPAEKSAVYAEKWFAPEVDEKGIYVDQNGNRVMTDGTKITADGQRILATEDTRQQGKRMESAKTVTARTGVATGATDGQIKTAERLAKILDKEIRFTREDGTGRNGEYDPEKDIIYVNAASKKGVTWVVAHELTHSVELSSEYNGLNSFVVAQMERDGVDVDALVKDTQKLYASHGVKLTDTEAKMEIVSDYAADYLLTDVKTIRALVENHPTVGQRIVAWADRILAKGGDENAEERIILRKARQMYAEALKGAEKKRMKQQEKTKVREEIRANDDPEADSAAEISMPEDDAVDYEAVLAQAEEVFPDAKWSITRTQKEQDAIMSKMRSILQNGGTAADLRAYVDTLGVQERAQTQKKPQGTNTRRQADAASQIVRAAHDGDMTVEEYLRENAELYETEDGWNRDAKRAIEMEQSGRGVKYSISPDLKSDLEKVLNGTFSAKNNEVYIGESSTFLTDTLKANALTVTMPARKAYAAMVTEEEARRAVRYDERLNYHGLGVEGLYDVLVASEEPVAAFAATENEDGKNRDDYIVIVTDKKAGDGNYVTVMEVDTQGYLQGKTISVNKTITAYDRVSIKKDIIDAAREKRLLHLDKKRSQSLTAGLPGSNSPGTMRSVDFENSIRHFWENVKWKKTGQKSFSADPPGEQKTGMAYAFEKAKKKDENTAQTAEKIGVDVDPKSKTAYVKHSIGKVDEVTKDEISALKKHFGMTKNYDVAGYLLTDGSMLDFSGKHWGGGSSDSRQVDHRDVLEGLGYDGVHDAGTNGIKAMTDMIGSGNIRLMPEAGGINLAVEPTKAQIDTLAGYIRHFHGEIVVDIDAPGGDTIESFSYNRGTAPMAVIRDIMNYFEDGTVPAPQPEYRQFRYSISQADDAFRNAEVNENIMEMIARVKGGDFRDNDKVFLGRVPDEVAEKIKNITGVDVSGFKVAIEARQIKHILKYHGENGLTNKSLADDKLIARMEYALHDPENIRYAGKAQGYSYEKGGHNRTADTVMYEKHIGEKSYYVVQAVADTNKKTLYIVTAFIGDKGYKEGTLQIANAYRPDETSKNATVEVPDKSIPQTKPSVKRKLSITTDRVNVGVDTESKTAYVKHSITKTEEGKDLPKPARAMRDFKNNLLALMSIPTRRKLEMGDMIYRYAEQIVKNGRLTEQDRKAFFDMMYNSGVVTLAATEYNKAIRSAVARGKIFVSNELREAIGTEWNTLRNRAFAAGVYLTKNENDPDVKAWQKELSGMFPKTFDAEDTDTRAVLDRIVEYAERGKGEEITLQEHAARLADENYLSMKEFLFELERKFDAELRLFAEKAEIEIDIQEKQAKQKEKEIRKRKEQIEQQRWDDAVHERQRETLKALQWLRSHQNLAPEDLRQQFEEVLAGIDTFAIGHVNERKVSDKYGMTYADISKMYKKLQEEDPNFLPSQELDRIMKRVDYDKIGDMDIGALQNLYQAALALRTEFYNRKNVMGEMNYELFDDVYDQVKEEINRTKGAPKTEGKALFDRLFNGEQLTPMNVLKRMGGWANGMLYKMAKQLEKGELDEQAYNLKAGDVIRDFEKRHQGWLAHADGQGEDDWITTKVPRLLAMRVGAKPEYGGTVELHMTKLQRVHMLLESESMENLLHMSGGRTFPDVELYRQGKREAAFARGETVRLSPETVKALVSNMTKEEIELANILREYYNGFAKKEINRVSNILYGYDKAMSKRYAPIYTNQNYVNSEPGIFDVTAEGAGNLKSRQHAKNPSLQISALDAFEKHAKRTARFVGLAIPIRNWNTLMNWREKGNSMRDVITHKWGKQGVEYIEKLLTDLQGGKVQETSLIDEAISKLHSNYISSAFGANISIVTKQLGSIAMAMPELDPRYLPSPRKAMKPDKKLIAAYTAVLEYRGLGYATPETKMLKEHPNWSQKNKAVQFALGGGSITAMDQFSAGVLWPWAENKVRAEHPELEMGSDEQITAGESPFYKKVAEVFNDAVWNSQSASDIMHQSTLRRSNSALVRSFTMFKSDSAQAYNQLRRLIGEAQYLRDSKAPEKEQKAAKRRVGQAVLGILINNGFAASVSFVNAWIKNGAKGYKDDEDELTVLSVLGGMTRDMITGLAGVFALGEELADLIGNVMAKERIYDIETPGIDVLNDLINAVASGTKNAAGFVDGAISIIKNGGDLGRYLAKNARDVFGAVKSTAIEVSSLLGVPAANVEAYLVGFVRIVSPEMETAYQDLFGTQTKSDLVGLKGAALDQRVGDILMSRDVELTKDAVQTIAALYDSGHKSVIPSDVPSSITIDEESHKLNEAQKQKYAEVWAYAVGKNLQGVLNSEEFREADLDSKVYMVGKVYRYGEEFAKKALFEEYKLTEWVLEVSKFEDADMDIAQYLGVQDTKNGIYERTEDKDFCGVEFAKWVVEQEFTDEQLRVIRDVFGKEPENYYNLVAAGVNSDRAYRLLKNLIKLEPADGRKSVTSVQKARVVVDALLPEDEEMAALSQVLSESDYAKTEMAAAHKVKPSIYVTFKELLPQYDVNGNGSYSQEEVERAIDAIGPKTGIALPSYGSANALNTNLNNSQRAVLWQLANKSWKPESNPYNTSVGRKVYEELNND